MSDREFERQEPSADSAANELDARSAMFDEVRQSTFTTNESFQQTQDTAKSSLPGLGIESSKAPGEHNYPGQPDRPGEGLQFPRPRPDKGVHGPGDLKPNPADTQKDVKDVIPFPGREKFLDPGEKAEKAKETADKVYDLLKDGNLSEEDKKALGELLNKAYNGGYLPQLGDALDKKLKESGFGVTVEINSDFANVKGVDAILVTVKGLGDKEQKIGVKVEEPGKIRIPIDIIKPQPPQELPKPVPPFRIPIYQMDKAQ